MRCFVLTAIFCLLLSPFARAQEVSCAECMADLAKHHRESWGGKRFCSSDCKAAYVEEQRKYYCKICNEECHPPARVPYEAHGPVVVINLSPPRWDGYCDFCREGVEDGSIDPERDRYRPEPEPGVAALPPPAPGPVAAPPEAREDASEEDAAVLGMLEWVLGIGIGVVLLLRWVLK